MIRVIAILAIALVFSVDPAIAQGLTEEAKGFWDSLGFGFMAEAVPGRVMIGGFLAYKAIQIVAKLIPNDATGFLGMVRQIAKVASGYVTNRQHKGDPIA